jgi:dihydrofolate reductase
MIPHEAILQCVAPIIAIERVEMRNVIAAEYLSLDGVMEDPGPAGEFEHRAWTVPYWNDELARYQSELLFASSALLLGRVTYEEFVASWPKRSNEDPFTNRINKLPKLVASTTLEEPLPWNATLLKGDVAEAVMSLKQQSGQDLLLYGSGQLLNRLMQHNLIDVYRVMVYPLVLGSGKRLFKDGVGKTTLTLHDAKTTATGVVVLTYKPANPGS